MGKLRRLVDLLFDDPGSCGPRMWNGLDEVHVEGTLEEAVLKTASAFAASRAAHAPARIQPSASCKAAAPQRLKKGSC